MINFLLISANDRDLTSVIIYSIHDLDSAKRLLPTIICRLSPSTTEQGNDVYFLCHYNYFMSAHATTIGTIDNVLRWLPDLFRLMRSNVIISDICLDTLMQPLIDLTTTITISNQLAQCLQDVAQHLSTR